MHELAFRSVGKRFADGTCALQDVSFAAPGGRLTSLLGPSGSGKSTLLRIAAGLDAATSGAVFLNDCNLALLHPAERSITLLSQADSLFPHLDVIGNASFGLKHAGIGRSAARQRARDALALVGLEGFDHRPCSELSGGQQQRVALARALALEPSAVLLDEPLSNLDDRLRRQLREELRTLQRRLGITMLYVTHDESEAMAVSDHMVIIHEGRLLQQGSPREVYEHPSCEFVAGFMGDAGIFGVTVGDGGSLALGPLQVPLAPVDAPAGTQLRLMVRPEAWRIMAVGTTQGLPGRIRRCAYLGHGAEYVVDTEFGELLVNTRHAEVLHQRGAPVNLGLADHGVTVLDG